MCNLCSYHQKYLLRCSQPLFRSLGLEEASLVRSALAAKLNALVGGFASQQLREQLLSTDELNEQQRDALKNLPITDGQASCIL